MIVGVPNVGKSSLINRLTGRKSTQTGDRPGVTKGKQWLSLPGNMQLLDTPGILWPKFEDPEVGLNLAFCGSIKDEILDVASLALELVSLLQREYPELLAQRISWKSCHRLRWKRWRPRHRSEDVFFRGKKSTMNGLQEWYWTSSGPEKSEKLLWRKSNEEGRAGAASAAAA